MEENCRITRGGERWGTSYVLCTINQIALLGIIIIKCTKESSRIRPRTKKFISPYSSFGIVESRQESRYRLINSKKWKKCTDIPYEKTERGCLLEYIWWDENDKKKSTNCRVLIESGCEEVVICKYLIWSFSARGSWKQWFPEVQAWINWSMKRVIEIAVKVLHDYAIVPISEQTWWEIGWSQSFAPLVLYSVIEVTHGIC